MIAQHASDDPFAYPKLETRKSEGESITCVGSSDMNFPKQQKV